MFDKIKSIAGNKYVLLGGAGIAVIAAYMYFSGDSEASISDGGYLEPAIFPPSVAYGSSYPSTDTGTNLSTIGPGEQALIELQKMQLTLDAEKWDVQRDVATLENATRNRELDLIYGAKDKDRTAANYGVFAGLFSKVFKNSPKLDKFTATVGGDTFTIDIDTKKKKKKKPDDKDKTPKKKTAKSTSFLGSNIKSGTRIAPTFQSGNGNNLLVVPTGGTQKSIANTGSYINNLIGLTKGGKVNVTKHNKLVTKNQKKPNKAARDAKAKAK